MSKRVKLILALGLIIVILLILFLCFHSKTTSNKDYQKKSDIHNNVEKITENEVDNQSSEDEENNNSDEEVNDSNQDSSSNDSVTKTENNNISQANSSSSNSTTNNKSNSSNNNNNNSSSNTKSSNNNSSSVPNNSSNKDNGNEINKNTIDYSTHRGRIDKCSSNAECTNKGVAFYSKYKRVIANFFVLDVTTNNGNILGYFIQYEFKEGEYETESECNIVGASIKSELSDRVTGFKCTNRNDKYYLSITTDYS